MLFKHDTPDDPAEYEDVVRVARPSERERKRAPG